VWVAAADGRRSTDLTAVLAHAWGTAGVGSSVVPEGGGWLAWRSGEPVRDRAAFERTLNPLSLTAGRHGLMIGVGGVHSGVVGVLRSVDEAQLAARSGSGAPGKPAWFEELGLLASLGSVPWDEVAQVADLCLPALVAARDRAVLAGTLLALLDCGGSATAAADRLGVHRNTVLARTNRARDLGVDLDDPDLRLPLHLVCRGITLADRPADNSM
jgi:sugar diacid utilization regulator